MNTTMTLWSDATTRTRHFLIPDGADLPTGDFELRTVKGRQKRVNAEIVVIYEVTHEEAKAWLKDQFGQVIDSAKESLMESIRSKMAQEPDLDAWFGERTETTTSKPGTRVNTKAEAKTEAKTKANTESPALSLFTALSGESAEQLQSDPQSVARAIQSLLSQLGAIFSDAIAADDARVDAARERFTNLRHTLQQHGLNVDDALDTFPYKIRETFRSAEQDIGTEEIAERLEALAEGLEEAAAKVAEWLRGQAKDIRQREANVETAKQNPVQKQRPISTSDTKGG